MDGNDLTLNSYDEHVQEYIDGTPHKVGGDRQKWLDEILDQLPSNSTILELGTGNGRDADYIESRGYKVDRTDASQGFVDHLNKNGKHARLLNALTDDFGQAQDMIFANAVFLHFKPADLENVLKKARQSLKNGGVLAFTVKKGHGEGWSQHKLNAPRYFNYWQPDDLKVLLSNADFIKFEISESHGKSDDWIQVAAFK